MREQFYNVPGGVGACLMTAAHESLKDFRGERIPDATLQRDVLRCPRRGLLSITVGEEDEGRRTYGR